MDTEVRQQLAQTFIQEGNGPQGPPGNRGAPGVPGPMGAPGFVGHVEISQNANFAGNADLNWLLDLLSYGEDRYIADTAQALADARAVLTFVQRVAGDNRQPQ